MKKQKDYMRLPDLSKSEVIKYQMKGIHLVSATTKKFQKLNKNFENQVYHFVKYGNKNIQD